MGLLLVKWTKKQHVLSPHKLSFPRGPKPGYYPQFHATLRGSKMGKSLITVKKTQSYNLNSLNYNAGNRGLTLLLDAHYNAHSDYDTCQ